MFVDSINPLMPQNNPENPKLNKKFIVVASDRLVCHAKNTSGEYFFWTIKQLEQAKIEHQASGQNLLEFVAHDHVNNYFALFLESDISERLTESYSQYSSLTIREIAGGVSELHYSIMSMTLQIGHWLAKHQYCGCCGTAMIRNSDERALVCSQCNNREYIKVHPCIIVKVTKGEQILLCRSPHFRPGLFSNVAGFIEPGEHAEKAVWREVKEETNISIKNIRYLGSQTWPFPSQIMLAFEAEYEAGEIKVDGHEVVDAKWFNREYVEKEFQDLIQGFSISGWLVKKYLKDLDAQSSI
jgi:NADH pyrophosphatase NudC (nudix superfamily)